MESLSNPTLRKNQEREGWGTRDFREVEKRARHSMIDVFSSPLEQRSSSLACALKIVNTAGCFSCAAARDGMSSGTNHFGTLKMSLNVGPLRNLCERLVFLQPHQPKFTPTVSASLPRHQTMREP